jgi:hypothetical protein
MGRRWIAGAITAGSALAWPTQASAHGLSGRADLPVPTWLFSWASAAVLVASFAALAVMWPRPRLEHAASRALPARFSRPLTSRALEILLGFIGAALLALTLWAGFIGGSNAVTNIVPTLVYVAFWIGLVLASVLFGDVFRAVNPWRAVGRATGLALRRAGTEPLPYPAWLGRWPAALTILGFVWLEVGSSSGDKPAGIATAVAVYSVVTWVGMALWGVETWTRYGEGFSVYFNLFSRLSIFERRGREIRTRPFLSGLSRLDVVPGTVALLAVMIGTVTFDGLSAGPGWQEILQPVVDRLRERGLGPQAALELTYAISLVTVILLVAAFYRLGIAGTATVDRRHAARVLAGRFVHTLVPIALAYAAAHYVSLLVFQGQALAYLASDPAGFGWNLFGTATWEIDYGVLGAQAFWYIQLALVLGGHLAALVLAHDRALVVYDDARIATRSQYWMLTVMVGFTMLALWLLSEASKG